MAKGVKVGRPDFEQIFASVNSFHALIDYSQAHVLGEVYHADENHDGKVFLRIRRELPKRAHPASVCFIWPLLADMSLGQALNLAMNFGLRPAIHHEVAASLKGAVPEQIHKLFDLADISMLQQGFSRRAMVLSVASLGSAVAGESGEMIPVHQLTRTNWPNQLHLRKLDFDAPVPPAQSLAFVNVE